MYKPRSRKVQQPVWNVMPPNQQNMVRIRLAENLKATVSQRLLPRKTGKGRVAALEILRMTKTIEEFIKDPLKTHEIKEHEMVAEARTLI